jgi:hypothetical protein
MKNYEASLGFYRDSIENVVFLDRPHFDKVSQDLALREHRRNLRLIVLSALTLMTLILFFFS